MDDNKKGAATRSETDGRAMCFIISRFGQWPDVYYDEVFRPAIEEAGLQPRRVDHLDHAGDIVRDIWDCTDQAAIVLADLTGMNPNVLYELGLAHGRRKPAILIIESTRDIPFDLKTLRVIPYDRNAPSWGAELRTKISRAIRDTVATPLAGAPSILAGEQSGLGRWGTVQAHESASTRATRGSRKGGKITWRLQPVPS